MVIDKYYKYYNTRMRGRTVCEALIYNGETKVSRPLVNIEMNHHFAHGKYPEIFLLSRVYYGYKSKKPRSNNLTDTS